jgi:hypothetical protein
MIDEYFMERDFGADVQIAKGRVALGKSFSFVSIMLVTTFFGFFCFLPEQMAVLTSYAINVSVLMFVGFILISMAVSLTFVVCAENSEGRVATVESCRVVK